MYMYIYVYVHACVFMYRAFISGHHSPSDEAVKYRSAHSEGEVSLSPQSPLSPRFTPPPIRNAALRSMFPQVSNIHAHVHVYTMYMYNVMWIIYM